MTDTTPILTDDEIDVLNGARNILKALADNMRTRSYERPSAEQAPSGMTRGVFDYGRVSATADAAENAVFNVLNVVNAYLGENLSHEQLRGVR